MICFGDEKRISELKKLWKECFADEDAYINAFFESLYQKEHVLLEEENGVLMGASFFLPGSIYREEAGWRQIRYVYALAVYPQYRGRGIAGRLLRQASERYQAPLIAEPAEEGLVGGFYKPLGFSEDFYLKKRKASMPQYDLQAAGLQAGQEICQADAAAYSRIRDRHFQRNGYVRWPEEHVAFAIAQHQENGGDALVVSGEGREDILLYYVEDGQAVVTETSLAETEVTEVLARSLRQPCSTVLVTNEVLPEAVNGAVDMSRTGSGEDCYLTGVSFGNAGMKGYLNITLD